MAGRCLFVSHNMAAVESLCSHAIELRHGHVVRCGTTGTVIAHYRTSITQLDTESNRTAYDRCRHIKHVEVIDDNGKPTSYVALGGTFEVKLLLKWNEAPRRITIGIGIDSSLGQRMLTVFPPKEFVFTPAATGLVDIRCRIDNFPLAPGQYSIKCGIAELGKEFESVEHACAFSVTDGNAFDNGRGFHRGVCLARSTWRGQS
jgi:lipopolysaccharide transport system ATP-binding protein